MLNLDNKLKKRYMKMLQENNSELLHDVLFYFTSKYSCSIYFQKLKQNLNLQ